MSIPWIMLDAHQMGRRLHLGVPDKDGKGYHDKNPRDIVAIRFHPDGSAEGGVWGDDGELCGARELQEGEFDLIRVLDAGEKTTVERVKIGGRKVAGVAGGVVAGRLG